MGTRIEDLANELWLDLFDYLNLHEQFKAFSGLNKRLNAVLFSYRSHISYNNNDKNSQYLFTNLLPSLPRREEVTSLRLEKTKKVRSILEKINSCNEGDYLDRNYVSG